jgi:hypothetical protein
VRVDAAQKLAENLERVHWLLVFGRTFPQSFPEVAMGRQEWAKEWKGKGMRIEKKIERRFQRFPFSAIPLPVHSLANSA